MNNIPCKDCITLAICRKLILDDSIPIGGNLLHKCRPIRNYLLDEKRSQGEDGFEHINLSINQNRFRKLMEFMKNV